jgi:hypothetical protein
MSKPIDLGRKLGENVTPISISDLKDETHYPDLYISEIDDSRLADMPDEGEALIKYKVITRSHNEHQRDGKKEHRCSITLEVRSIDPPPPKEKKKKDPDGGARKAFSDYFKDK